MITLVRFLAAVSGLLLTTAVQAQWLPRVQVTGPEVRVNDVPVFKVRTPLGGIQPGERARVGAERLRELVKAGLTPQEIRVDIESETHYRQEKRTVTKMVEKTVTRRIKKKRRRVKIEVPVKVRQSVKVAYEIESEARLIARGKVLAIATAAEAKSAGQPKPSGLVEGWAGALRRALSIPGIAVGNGGVIVPWTEKRYLKISGAARGPITVQRESGEGSAIEAQFEPKTGMITVLGKTVGRDVLIVSREGATARVDVAVQPYAAQLQVPQPVVLTGRGVDGEKVAKLVLASVRAAVAPLAGAAFKIETDPGAVPPPSSGKSLTVPVAISVTGPEMLPVRRSIKVPVVARSLPPVETSALFFSNNPERVKESQTLYVARLSMGTARLLYHHQNGIGQPVWFVAELINDTDQPSQVQVLGTDAGPVRDTVWVGYRAASDFLTAHSSNSGMVIEVPPHSRVAFQATRFANELTISGLFELRLVSGSAPLVRVAADKLGDPSSVAETLRAYPVSEAFQTQVREAEQASSHIYPKPSITLTARHAVGGRWGVFSVGRAPLTNTNNQVLEGNYGVFYDVTVNLENPTPTPATIKVIFEPAGGMAGAVFVIEGKRVEIPRTNLPTETTLATFRLAPGEKRTIPIRTLPISGSNYPINLYIR